LSALGDAVVCIPPEINTIGLLREYMRIDELQAEQPAHDLFIVAYKTHPDNPFAVLMRLPRELHIQGRWPVEVDYDSRVVVVYPPNQVPLGDGRVG
jgi:hypothetical protein